MKDYFGQEIRIGDVVLYSQRGSHGYQAAFSECVVKGFKGKNCVVVTDGYYRNGARLAENVINLTALGIRKAEPNDKEAM